MLNIDKVFHSSSNAVGREPCPNCRKFGKDTSGDNLIRYDDGHAFCFSCRHRIPSNKEQFMEQALKNEISPKTETSYIISLPHDCTKAIDYKALEWLSKYEITRQEVIGNDLLWSPSRQMLVFPIRGANNDLLAWQGRSFGDAGKGKWFSQGPIHNMLHILALDKFPDCGIIIVEDIVSAIKVSRYAPCMPLFGSELSLQLRLRLRHLTRKLVIWLDEDKWANAVGYAHSMEILGVVTHVIYTEKDPKECDDTLIKESIRV